MLFLKNHASSDQVFWWQHLKSRIMDTATTPLPWYCWRRCSSCSSQWSYTSESMIITHTFLLFKRIHKLFVIDLSNIHFHLNSMFAVIHSHRLLRMWSKVEACYCCILCHHFCTVSIITLHSWICLSLIPQPTISCCSFEWLSREFFFRWVIKKKSLISR